MKRSSLLLVLTLAAGLMTGSAAQAHVVAPVTPNAHPEAVKLLNWLSHSQDRAPSHGNVVSGLFGGHSGAGFSLAPDAELHGLTGEHPAIYSCDFGKIGQPAANQLELPNLVNTQCVNDLSTWAANGGVASVSITLANPAFVQDTPSGYGQPVATNGGGTQPRQGRVQSQNDFEQLKDLFTTNGQRFANQLNRVAEGLQLLENADVPVLFRPFHQMNNPTYWWGDQEVDDFVFVWRVMFDYLTKPEAEGGKDLSNLLWVFSPSIDTTRILPGAYFGPAGADLSGMVDIVAPDLVSNGVAHDIAEIPATLIGLGGKAFGLAEVGSLNVLTYDYFDLIEAMRDRLLPAAFFIALNGDHSPARDVSQGRRLMNDMGLINRDETNGKIPTEAGTQTGWSAPVNIGGPRTSTYVGTSAVASMSPRRIDLFVLRNLPPNGNSVEHRTYVDGAVTLTEDLALPPGYTYANEIAAVSWGYHRVDLFLEARPSPGGPPRVFGTRFTPNWSGAWEDLSLGKNLFTPTVSSWGPKRLDLFAVEAGKLMHRWTDDNGNWVPFWEDLGGLQASGPSHAPTAISWGPNRIDLFQLNAGYGVSHKWWDGTAWSTWQQVPGQTAANNLWSSLTASTWRAGHVDLYARGSDGNLRHNTWDTDRVNPVHGTGWSNWQTITGPKMFEGYSPAGAVSRAYRKIDLFYVGQTRGTGAEPGIHRRTWGCGTTICDPGEPTPSTRTAVAYNSASFQQCTRDADAKCANGSFISFNVSPPPTATRGPLDFVSSAGGMSITLNECGGQALRLTYIAVVGKDADNQDIVQINAYQQGHRGGEPHGTCPPTTAPSQDVTWRINGSAASGFGTLEVPGRLWHTTAALFSGYNQASAKYGPSGFLFIPRQWSHSGQDEYKYLPDCLATPANCPISTRGNANFLVMYANGMEEDGCPSLNPCNAVWQIGLSAGTVINLPTLFVGEAGLGYDQINVALPPTVQPNIEYSIVQTSRHAGFTYPFESQTGIKVKLGPPN